MAKSLTKRREALLRIIVGEYIATAQPVASETIFRNYELGVSPATIRNDMAYLESEGYIMRPYTSAGTIPLDKAYRYYVESLTQDVELPPEEQSRIRNLFAEAEVVERWLKLAATLVASLVRNAALVTFPKARQSRFRHLELVAVHEFLALLILVLSDTVLRRHLLPFDEPVTQEQLTGLAGKLNMAYGGLSKREIKSRKLELAPSEERVSTAVLDIMAAEDAAKYDEPYLEGLRYMLGQPEFGRRERMLDIMEIMEARGWLERVSASGSGDRRVRVVIGHENPDETLRELSLVFSGYGVPDRAGGTIVVVGPTRMDYRRAISSVSYMSDLLSDLVAGVYGGD
ncbi:MAG: heat-inducible transcription repressor HrcA [Chloroflexi bacterium]|nr:heat-inducible transcription repressor HrcA [Chloroflexota bacterium]